MRLISAILWPGLPRRLARWLLVLLMAGPLTAVATAPPDTTALRRTLHAAHQPDSARARAALALYALAPNDDVARRLATQAHAWATRAHDDRLMMKSLSALGSIKGRNDDLAGSLAMFQQALAIARRLHDVEQQSVCLHDMAVTADALDDFPAAVRYFRQALAVPGLSLDGRLTTQAALCQALINADSVDGNAEAERLVRQTLAQVRTPAVAAALAPRTYQTVIIIAGRVLIAIDHPAEAIALTRRELARLAPRLAQPTADKDLLYSASDLYSTQASGLVTQRAFPQAVRAALAGLALARRARQPGTEQDLLPVLVAALKGAGDPVGALRYQQRLSQLTDSLTRMDLIKEAQRLQVAFNTREKEARIRDLTQQRALAAERAARRQQQLWTLLVAVVAALLLLGGYLWQRAAAARRAAETRLRTRLAADLHDEVGALLTRISMRAELLQLGTPLPQLDELLTESRSAVGTVRDIIWSVDGDADTAQALGARLHDLLDRAAGATSRPAGFRADPWPAPDAAPVALRANVRQHTYLIGKEALTNALKHGTGATTLHLTLTPAELLLDVANAGATPAPAGRAGQGQRNMRQRAQLIGATLHTGPDLAGGWRVTLRVPRPLGR